MKSKKKKLLVIALFFVIMLIAIFYIKIPYTVSGNGVIKPVMEWRLEKSPDGIIINTLKNNLTNTVPSFSSTEFQRGDVVKFKISENLSFNTIINAGDTIGFLRSHLEELKLVELLGELEEKKRLRDVYLSGDKPELVTAAYEEMRMAEVEFETRQKLLQRLTTLHEQQVIADQELELAQNEFSVKRQQVNIARAKYQALTAGSKQEEIALVDASIHSLNQQIQITRERIDAFVVKAPITGTLSAILNNITEMEILARVIDTSEMLVLMPIDLNNLPYIKKEMKITIAHSFAGDTISGNVHFIDYNIEQLNQRQSVFVSGIIINNQEQLMPNLKVKANIHCGNITIAEYLRRLSRTVYSN